MAKTVITFGTFDVFHIGHLRILERARALGDRLVVGVSSDHLNFKKKQKYPVFSEHDRRSIVSALACVDEVFSEESLEWKGKYISTYNADILVMGDDWAGRFDEFKSLCEVIYLPRTENISTTEILAAVRATSA
ncbi:adenylyltransferase/cytidyltransferase family protein [Mesorhizobium sp. KR2-14]|uniref:adenylyltransferase/cytidyltransferase family protein n=1 Tax=Mesorhizobium sp. KR2-14 TaxID=3156610 RepID=UPI0032B458FE